MPTRARSRSSNTGPPESPLHTPRPRVSPSFSGSTRLSCCELGRSVATSVTARSLPAVLRSPCTATPKPATMNRSPTEGGARRSLNVTGARFGAGGAASLTRARSGASARGENCGCDATLATSFTTGRRPSNATSSIFAVGQHAMRGREHEIGCDRDAGAHGLPADDQHDVARDRLIGRRRAADHGGGALPPPRAQGRARALRPRMA